MTRRPKLAAVVASVAALAIAGCGGSDEPERLLPPGAAETVRTEVALIGDRVADGSVGACDDIFDGVDGGNFQDIDAALSGIPGNVDPQIRAALEQSIDRLRQLVEDACDDVRDAEQEEPDTPPEETVPDETEPETTPTEPETTPTEPEPPTTDEQPPMDEQPSAPRGGQQGGDGQGRGPTGEGPTGQDGDPGGGGVEAPDGD